METKTRRDLVTQFRYTISKWRDKDLNPNPFCTNVCSFSPFHTAVQRKSKEAALVTDPTEEQELDVPLPGWVVVFSVMVQLLKLLELVISRQKKSAQNLGFPASLHS